MPMEVEKDLENSDGTCINTSINSAFLKSTLQFLADSFLNGFFPILLRSVHS